MLVNDAISSLESWKAYRGTPEPTSAVGQALFRGLDLLDHPAVPWLMSVYRNSHGARESIVAVERDVEELRPGSSPEFDNLFILRDVTHMG